MTTIQLTEKHKSKLLEMCKVLFPEYRGGIYIHENAFNINQIYLIGFLDKNGDYIPNCDLYIHWFEFCCKKLAFQIYNFNIGKTETTYSTFVAECIIISKFNPVDYLYEEFKKLK